MHSSLVRRVATPAIALFYAGCQVYTPISLSSQVARDDIRLTLTDGAAADLARSLGVGVSQLEGHVDAVTDSTIVFRIANVTRVSGSDEKWSGEPVAIPRRDVATVERRSISVARSVIVGGAIVAGAVLAGTVAGSASGGSSSSPPSPVK